MKRVSGTSKATQAIFGAGEPALEDVLDDPIIRLLMARDRLAVEDVRGLAASAKRKLRLPA
jgi:hypothetical protein